MRRAVAAASSTRRRRLSTARCTPSRITGRLDLHGPLLWRRVWRRVVGVGGPPVATASRACRVRSPALKLKTTPPATAITRSRPTETTVSSPVTTRRTATLQRTSAVTSLNIPHPRQRSPDGRADGAGERQPSQHRVGGSNDRTQHDRQQEDRAALSRNSLADDRWVAGVMQTAARAGSAQTGWRRTWQSTSWHPSCCPGCCCPPWSKPPRPGWSRSARDSTSPGHAVSRSTSTSPTRSWRTTTTPTGPTRTPGRRCCGSPTS